MKNSRIPFYRELIPIIFEFLALTNYLYFKGY